MQRITAIELSCVAIGLGCVASCGSDTRPAADPSAGGAGGATTLASGGTAPDAGSSGGSVALVMVPNDEDEFPVPKPIGLAPTPPMGWNSWNAYATSVNATLIMNVADLIVSSGMKDAGYEYVNIDDGWAAKPRTGDDGGVHAIEADPVKFPPGKDGASGIKVLADYVHSKGLKLGIYSDRGSATCGGYTASGGHEAIDARAWADWGVDYLKYDNCNVQDSPPLRDGYRAMRDALDEAMAQTQNDIVFSLCSWQFDEWNPLIGQLWRTTGDIAAVFNDTSLLPSTYSNTILQIAAKNRAFAAYAGPNRWNDADMLEVGNLGNTEKGNTESQAHFDLWAMMASPLIAGNALDSMTPRTLEILTNRKVIAVDQDYLGLQGVLVKSSDSTMVWAKPLNKAGARAVLFINSGSKTEKISVSLSEVGLANATARVFDLWKTDDTGVEANGVISADVPEHGSVMLELDGQEPGIPSGTAKLSDLTWTYAANGTGFVRKNLNYFEKPLTINGNTYASGLGVAAGSKVIYRLAKRCSNFSAVIGVDDATKGAGSVQFQVWADGTKVYPEGDPTTMKGNDVARSVNVDLTGKHRLTLWVTSAGDGPGSDYADWADANLTCTP